MAPYKRTGSLTLR